MSIFTFTESMERGQYPVNIPTSLALESLMDIHPDHKWPRPPYLNYDEYWLNVRTLYRNICTSYSADMGAMLTPKLIAELMKDEWRNICHVIDAKSRMLPVLYACNYQSLSSRYKKHTIFKGDTTPRMMDERKRMERSIQQFLDDIEKDTCLLFNTDITPLSTTSKCIFQTHIAVDLLSHGKFDVMDLLESHTGNIKNRSLWYTKYYNGKDLSMIPFNHYFLRVFGDKEFFTPKDKALRKDIIEIAINYKWTSITSDGKVKMDLERLKNPFFKAVLKDMM